MRLRGYTPADEPAVRAIFEATVALGRPLGFELAGTRAYQRLCLGWFLGPGAEDAGLLEEGGEVAGYMLVATDLGAYRRWAAAAGARWAAGALLGLAGGRLRGDSARFHRLRLLDGWAALAGRAPSPMPAVVHLNLRPALRDGRAVRLLLDHADQRCRLAGLPGWYGEVNAPAGRRARPLAALGLEVVHRQPNHTLTWLAGRPVERLTVVRGLGRPIGRPGRGRLARPGRRRARVGG